MVLMMLSRGKVAVRLSGSALKNLLALTKHEKTISGKVNMDKMLRETRDLPPVSAPYCKRRKSMISSSYPPGGGYEEDSL